MMPITRAVLDSNVLISILNRSDKLHARSRLLMELLQETQCEVLAPTLILWETQAYRNHPEKAKSHTTAPDVSIKLTVIDVTSGLYTRTYSDMQVTIHL